MEGELNTSICTAPMHKSVFSSNSLGTHFRCVVVFILEFFFYAFFFSPFSLKISFCCCGLNSRPGEELVDLCGY